MSTNFHIYGKREIKIIKTGGVAKQETYFDCWQTPTEVTKMLVKSPDPIKAYKDWIMTLSVDEVTPIYREADIFCEGPVLGYITINPAKDHIKELETWVLDCEKEGFTILWESW